MDPAALERLSDQTRSLVETTPSRLIQLFYWHVFVELLLEARTSSSVYYEDALPEVERLLGQSDLDLYDPLLRRDLGRLAFHAALPRNPTIEAAQAGIREHLEHPPTPPPAAGPSPAGLQVSILLALRGHALWGRTPEFAVPAPLTVQASRNVREPGRIIWHNEKAAADPITSAADRALKSALHVLGYDRPLLSYEIQIEKPGLFLRGDSLGLGLALLFHAFEAAERRRPHQIPAPDSAIVGSVDDRGVVAPVSSASLGAKIRAAAGAGFRRLLLPEANLEEGAAELKRLREQLPNQTELELVPVGDLAQALGRPDLWIGRTVPVRRLIHRPRIVRIGVGTVALLVLLALAFWNRPISWVPTNTSVNLPSTDRSRVVLRVASFPPRERVWEMDTLVQTAILADLSPLTRSALLIGTDVTGAHPGTLYCYDFSKCQLLWSRSFANAPGLPESTRQVVGFRVMEIITTDLDGDGNQDIICSAHASPLSPCYVYWLSAAGEIRAMYVHRGYLFGLTAEDFDRDGRTEVFLRGTSNADQGPYTQRATVVVLDKDHFSGWPAGGPFAGSNQAPFDSSRARLVFPAIPEYCQITSVPGATVTKLWVNSTQDRPSVIATVALPGRPGLVVTLGADLQPVRIVAEDNLMPLVRSALDTGEIHRDFTSPDALARYMEQIEHSP